MAKVYAILCVVCNLPEVLIASVPFAITSAASGISLLISNRHAQLV